MRHLPAAALLSLLLSPLLPSCGGGEPATVPTTTPSTAAAESPAAPQASQEAVGEGSSEQEADPSAPATLLVKLKLKGSGQPLGNVPFDVQWTDEGAPSKTSSRTDPDGSRRIAFDHGSQLIAVIPGSSPYSAPVFYQDKTVLMGGLTHEVEIEVPPGGIATGVVYDEAGEPVPHVTVTAFFRSPEELDKMAQPPVDSYTETDDQGRFGLGGFPAGPFVLESGSETHVAVFRPGGVMEEGQRLDGLEIFLEPAHEVYGQVIDEDEQPVAGAKVVSGKPLRRQNRKPTAIDGVWLYQARAIVTTSDADGLFTLPAVPDSQAWNINVSHPDFRRYAGHFEAGQVDVWITLEGGAALGGQVVDADGRGLGQVQVWMFLPDGQDTTFTDLKGNYRFAARGEVDEAYLLFFKPEAGMHLEGPLKVTVGSPAVDVALEGGQVLEGHVVDGSGAPVQGAMVTIEGQLPDPSFARARMPERFLEMDAVLTNEDGYFRFEQLDENHYEVHASKPGVGEARAPGVATGRPNLVLKLSD